MGKIGGTYMLYSGYDCDKCGISFEYRRTSKDYLPKKTSLIVFARRNGWSIGKQVLCPTCRKVGKKINDETTKETN